ncbi:unnamed protein product [Closterium sp. NIES-54]
MAKYTALVDVGSRQPRIDQHRAACDEDKLRVVALLDSMLFVSKCDAPMGLWVWFRGAYTSDGNLATNDPDRANDSVVTEFMALLTVEKADAASLLNLLLSHVQTVGIDLRRIAGISTDRANVMMGCKSGHVTRLRPRIPHLFTNNTVFVCMYREALAAKDAYDDIPDFKIVDKVIWNVAEHLGRSGPWHQRFLNLHEVFTLMSLELQGIHAMRWLSRGDVVLWFLAVLPAVIVMLKEYDKKMFALVSSYRFHFLMNFIADMLEQLNILNRAFQHKEALHTFTLDSGASRSFFRDSTTLTPLSQPVAVSLADPSGGPVLAQSSTVLLSSPASAPCSCRPLSHETLLWHHRLGHPSLPRLRGMASCTLHAAPHSSEFPPTEAPLQTLHMDMWDPTRVHGQGQERYFLLVVDDYSRYTAVFPLRSKGEVTEVLIVWIHDRGGEFSSDLLRAFCRAEGIRQTFTLPASPQQNGIAERRIGMVMDVARTSMIHAAAPHLLWPFAVQYSAHQINLQPCVSLSETTPTLRWTGKVGDVSVFRVWGSRAFVRDTSADKLSSRAVPCVFLGFPPDAPGWQFYHPTLRRVLSSQDVTFDELGPAPSGVSQVDPVAPVEVAVDSGAARGAEPAGAGTGGAEPGVAKSEGAEPEGAEPERVKPRAAT